MTRHTHDSHWSRTVFLGLTLAALLAVAFNVWGDAQSVAQLGAGLGRRAAPLDAQLARAAGGVLEHLAFRTMVHACATGVLVAVAVVLLRRGRGTGSPHAA